MSKHIEQELQEFLYMVNGEQDAAVDEARQERLMHMKIVERTVRQVRATTARKLKMREELLAHLAEIFEEEKSKHPHAVEATRAAASRFGNPSELACELQATVPRFERYEATLNHWFGWRAPETPTQYLLRTTAQIACLMMIVTLTAAAVYVAKLGWSKSALIGMRPILVTQFIIPVAFLLLGALYLEQRNTWFGVFGRPRSMRRLLLVSILFVLVVTACSCVIAGFSRWGVESVLFGILPFLGIGFVAAVGSLVIARFNGPDEIRETLWANLDLET